MSDPTGQLAYAVHPYLRPDGNTPSEWDAKFGKFAASHPVVATEWSHLARNCESADGKVSRQLLDYLEARRIGLVGYGVDSEDSRLVTTKGSRLEWTTFDGLACTAPGAGPGEDIRKLFERLADRQATARAMPGCAASR